MTQVNFLAEVEDMNLRAGNHKLDGWDQLSRQEQIIRSELDELRRSIDLTDIHGVADDLADLLVTVFGGVWMTDFAINSVFMEVIRALRTRIDTEESKAHETMAAYHARGIKCHVRSVFHPDGNTYYPVISSAEQYDSKGLLVPEGKWLKSKYADKPNLLGFVTGTHLKVYPPR